VTADAASDRVLTEEESRRLLEERTRRYFGMSLDEFISAYEAGALAGIPAATEIAMLAGARPR